MIKYWSRKHGVKLRDLQRMHPELLLMFAFVVNFCKIEKVPCTVTSIHRTAEQDRRLGAKSKTHQEYRAFDMSLNGWAGDKIIKLRRAVENEFKHVGAISATSRSSRPIVIHDIGHGMHAHFQIRPNL